MKSSDVTGLCGKTRLFCLKLKEKKTISTETETSGSEKGSMWDSQTETMEILSTVTPPYNTHTFCNVGRVASGAFMGVLIVADTADRQRLSRTSHVACNLTVSHFKIIIRWLTRLFMCCVEELRSWCFLDLNVGHTQSSLRQLSFNIIK